MKLSRAWLSPLVGGVFVVTSATGVALFFHVGSPLGRTLHEWLGLAMLGVAVTHAFVNWKALRGYLRAPIGRGVISAFLGLTLLALAPLRSGASPTDAARPAISALARTPLRALAPIAGRDVDRLVAELRGAGFPAASADSSCDDLAGADREKLFRALAVVFPAGGTR